MVSRSKSICITNRYAAIFDADFEPPEDYLEETIPRLYKVQI